MADDIKTTDFPADAPATEASTAETAATDAPAFTFVPAVPAQRDGHLNKMAREKLKFDKWTHRAGLLSGIFAAAATGVLAGAATLGLAFSIVALPPLVIPVAAAAAAGFGAFAVGSSIVRRFAVTGKWHEYYRPPYQQGHVQSWRKYYGLTFK